MEALSMGGWGGAPKTPIFLGASKLLFLLDS